MGASKTDRSGNIVNVCFPWRKQFLSRRDPLHGEPFAGRGAGCLGKAPRECPRTGSRGI